jgi:hypothetical protein
MDRNQKVEGLRLLVMLTMLRETAIDGIAVKVFEHAIKL